MRMLSKLSVKVDRTTKKTTLKEDVWGKLIERQVD